MEITKNRIDEKLLKEIRENGLSFLRLHKEYREDKVVVLECVKNCGHALMYAATYLQNDKEIVREAVKSCGLAFKHAGYYLRNQRDFVLEMAKIDGFSLEYSIYNVSDDAEILLEGINNCPSVLNLASDRLQNNYLFLKQTAIRNGFTLYRIKSLFSLDSDIICEGIISVASNYISFQSLENIINKFVGKVNVEKLRDLRNDLTNVFECKHINETNMVKKMEIVEDYQNIDSIIQKEIRKKTIRDRRVFDSYNYTDNGRYWKQ